jgi:hypothetical protein
MTADHALFFIFNGPREGRSARAMEALDAKRAFWEGRKKAGDISDVDVVMLASTGNQNMPAGFFLVTGERSKLQDLRWNNEEFLNVHTSLMMTLNGYACIDGYTGKAFDKHIERLNKLMTT